MSAARFSPIALSLCAVFALLLSACADGKDSPREAAQEAAPQIASNPAAPAPESEAVTRFIDILADYQALNARLDAVAQRLQRANAALCPVTRRDPGYSVHSIGDYPDGLHEVARGLLNVDERLSVRTVRMGTSAEAGGLRPGDRLIGVNGTRFAGGHTQRLFYDRSTQDAFARQSAELTIARGTDISTLTVTPETLCGYPAYVFFDDNINGHTDGEAVWITSELMRTVADDRNLALIVAHEMAHAMAGHMAQTPSQTLELEADAMALIMLARAGYDIERVVRDWEAASHPHHALQDRSDTHPSINARLENFTTVLARIRSTQAAERALDFTLLAD